MTARPAPEVDESGDSNPNPAIIPSSNLSASVWHIANVDHVCATPVPRNPRPVPHCTTPVHALLRLPSPSQWGKGWGWGPSSG